MPASVPEDPPEDPIEIQSGVNNELVLDVNSSGGIIQEVRDEKRVSQQWQLVPVVDGAENYYHIYHIYHIAQSDSDGSGVSVLAAINDRTLAVQGLRSDRMAQQWELQSVSGSYIITNRQYGSALSVDKASSQPGAEVVLYEDLGRPNQKWHLIHSKHISPGWAGMDVPGIAGGTPFCDWKPIPTQMNDKRHVPIIVELFKDPLSPTWPLEKNQKTTITRSISFDDTRAPEYSAIDGFNDTIHAIIVRPGPHFNPRLRYKVTLYADWNYSAWMLPLTLGVYPDLRSYNFGDITSSIKFEQGTPTNFKEPYSAALTYYAPFAG